MISFNDVYRYLTEYEIERMENIIARFIKINPSKNITQTIVYKILAYIDNYFVIHDGSPIFPIEYKAMQHGPVPIKLYAELKVRGIESKYILTEREDNKTFFKLKKKNFTFNDKIFSPFEERLLDDLFTWLPSYFSAGQISESSHQDIAAWIKSWDKRKENANINDMHWVDTFDMNYNKKFKEVIQKLNREELKIRKEKVLESEAVLKARMELVYD